MKKLYFILFGGTLLLNSCIISKSPNIEYFKENKTELSNSKANTMSVNVPLFLIKPFVKKKLRQERDNPETVALIKKIKKLKILTIENCDQSIAKNFSNYLTSQNYTEYLTIKHDGENVNIKAIQTGDTIEKLMLTVKDDNDLVLIDIQGLFTPEDISKAINITQKN